MRIFDVTDFPDFLQRLESAAAVSFTLGFDATGSSAVEAQEFGELCCGELLT